MLSGLGWQLVADVSKQPNDPTVKGQADQEEELVTGVLVRPFGPIAEGQT